VLLVVLAVLALLAPAARADPPSPSQYALSGRVYDGAVGDESAPLQGVTVTLYGSRVIDAPGSIVLDSTTTNSTGWYGLDVPADAPYLYYHIIETNPATYLSVGATSVSGAVVNSDWIRYAAPLAGQTLTGNKFWDRPRATSTYTPTRTPIATATPTRPGAATATATPRLTATATRTATRTPTRPGAPTATVTATPSRTATRTPTRPGDPTATATPTHPPSSELADVGVSKALVQPPFHPVPPGSPLEYSITVRSLGPGTARNVVVADWLPEGVSFDAASGGCSLVQSAPPHDVVRCALGDLAAGTEVNLWLRAKLAPDVCGTITNTVTVDTFSVDPEPANNAFWAVSWVGPCPEKPLLRTTKTLVTPAGGVAHVGEVVRFRIDLQNLAATPLGPITLHDSFLLDDFDFVAASPPPTVNKVSAPNYYLSWEGLHVPAGGTLQVLLDLKAKRPGVTAVNCAQAWVLPEAGFGSTWIFEQACAQVRVEALEGRHFTVWKRFTNPSNHIAQLGDWLTFETQWTNIGAVTTNEVRVHDAIAPPSVSTFFPLDYGFLWPFQTGDWAKVGVTFKANDVASPAVNTASWTVTWPNGDKETRSASDYVYILDGELGKGLFIDKRLVAPQGGAVISDTVTYQIVITNATGADLPILSLTDTFPQPCLKFLSASLSPDVINPGQLIWNNLGPLPLGAVKSVEVRFHAEAACPQALNCAEARYLIPGAPWKTAADCAPLEIRGPRPELRLVKRRLSPSPVFVGDVVEYQVEVTNVGNAPVPVVPLHDGYQAAYFEFVSAAPPPDAVDPAHGRLDWNNLGPLAPGAKHMVNLRLRAIHPALGALNCAEAHYTVGASPLMAYDCATVDIRSRPPSIQVRKERLPTPSGLPPNAPLAQGELARYRVTVVNTGPDPLHDVVVEDHYDPGCAEFVASDGPATVLVAPGHLRWHLLGLPTGDSASWVVTLRLRGFCSPFANCALAHAFGPQGEEVGSDACVELAMVRAEPGLSISKRQVAPPGPVPVGGVVDYEIVVRNTGNLTLDHVALTDWYDGGCLAFVGAAPLPTYVGPNELHWDQVGPLGPGDAAIVHVLLRIKAPCGQMENCARAVWLVSDTPELEAVDCVPLVLARGSRPVYLPLILRNYPPTPPTPTPTRTVKPPATATRTQTPRPTATSVAGATVTGTPTRTTTTTATPTGTRTTTTLLDDDFDDGDLSGWTPGEGTWTNPGGYLRGAYASGADWCMTGVAGAAFTYEGKVIIYSGDAAGLTFRSSVDGASSYDIMLDAAHGTFQIGKRPSYTNLVGCTLPIERNRWYTIKVVVSGDRIEAYLDGSKRLIGEDTTYTTGYLGVILDSATAGYDDLLATQP